MRRPLAAMLVSAALLGGSMSAALAAGGTASRSSQASVTVAECHPSDDVTQRFASFNGQMRTVPGTRQMAMRFTLLERIGGRLAHFKPVSLPELKPWRRSKAGARTFIYAQRVTALRDNGSYRMRVQFRWYGDHKTLLRTTTLRSHSCRQPAPLPDLTIGSIGSAPAMAAGQRLYSITVVNNGLGEARNVPVELKVDGTVAGRASVDLLPAQESSVVQIQGPQCAVTVRAAVDPDRVLPETNDSNNTLAVPCTRAGG